LEHCRALNRAGPVLLVAGERLARYGFGDGILSARIATPRFSRNW
jgi:hypothetical protein